MWFQNVTFRNQTAGHRPVKGTAFCDLPPPKQQTYFTPENCDWRNILKHCAWRMIQKHCVWRRPDANQTKPLTKPLTKPSKRGRFRFVQVHDLLLGVKISDLHICTCFVVSFLVLRFQTFKICTSSKVFQRLSAVLLFGKGLLYTKGGADPTFASAKVKNAIGRIGVFFCDHASDVQT